MMTALPPCKGSGIHVCSDGKLSDLEHADNIRFPSGNQSTANSFGSSEP